MTLDDENDEDADDAGDSVEASSIFSIKTLFILLSACFLFPVVFIRTLHQGYIISKDLP